MMQTMSILINIVLAITIIQNADCNGPYLQNCETDLQCPDGYACLRPGYGEASAKAQMKCYPCCCREKPQCYIKSKLSGINCDCGDSGYTGACCETALIPPTCKANNTCFQTASECEQPGTGCYVEEQDQDDVISNIWSDAFMTTFNPSYTVDACRHKCLTYVFGPCVAYSINPKYEVCYVYSTTPAEGLATQYSPSTDLYVLRCSSC